MKAFFFLLISSLLFCSDHVLAQKKETGMKGGVNIINIPLELTENQHVQVGFNAGLYHRRNFTSHLAIQTELLLTQHSTTIDYEPKATKRIIRLNYLHVPVLLMATIGHFNIHAGAYGGLLVSIKSKNKLDPEAAANETRSIENMDLFRTIDTGIAGGIGFNFFRGNCGMRYNYGLNEVISSHKISEEGGKNSALQLYVGFEF